MTTYASPKPRTALARELAAADRIVLTAGWFAPMACDRCQCPLAFGSVCDTAPDAPYHVVDYVDGGPDGFWRKRGLHVCGGCARDEGWAAERLERQRGVRTGRLMTWARATGRRKR